MRQGFETAREGSAFGRPATAPTAALECVCAQGRKPEFVNPVTQSMKRLANPKAKAAGAACETVELGVERRDFAYR